MTKQHSHQTCMTFQGVIQYNAAYLIKYVERNVGKSQSGVLPPTSYLENLWEEMGGWTRTPDAWRCSGRHAKPNGKWTRYGFNARMQR